MTQIHHTFDPQWLEALKRETKSDDLNRLLYPRQKSGYPWPILFENAHRFLPLSEKQLEHYGRAPLSWCWDGHESLGFSTFKNAYSQGCGDFFIDLDFTPLKATNQLPSDEDLKELEHARFWLISSQHLSLPPSHLRWHQPLCAREEYGQGAECAEECASLFLKIQNLLEERKKIKPSEKSRELVIAVHSEKDFFQTLAKFRVMRLFEQALSTQSTNSEWNFTLLSLAPWREWTSYDCASNLIRQTQACAASFLAGADGFQWPSHDFHLSAHSQKNLTPQDRAESRYLAQAGQIVLMSESHLQEVHDPAAGSYTLDSLTEELMNQAWTLAKQWSALEPCEREQKKREHFLRLKTRHLENIQKRTWMQPGIGDFAQADEKVTRLSDTPFYHFTRSAQVFEDFRYATQAEAALLTAVTLVIGPKAMLAARLNYGQNILALMGVTANQEMVIPDVASLTQKDFSSSLALQNPQILLLITADENIVSFISTLSALEFCESVVLVAGDVSAENVHKLSLETPLKMVTTHRKKPPLESLMELREKVQKRRTS
jgi:hypothetical protein